MPAAPARARVRTVAAFGAFASGLALAYHLPLGVSVAWFAAACALLFVSLVTSGRVCVACMLGATFAFGHGWMISRVHEVSTRSLAHDLPAGERTLVVVEGVLERDPQVRTPRDDALAPPGAAQPSAAFDLRLTRVRDDDGWRASRERLRVRVTNIAKPPWHAGDSVRVSGHLLPVQGPANPGEPDHIALARQRNVAGTVFAPGAELIEIVDPPSAFARARAWFLGVRGDLRRSAMRAFGSGESPGASVMRALVLGERDEGSGEVMQTFRNAGIAHLMAISGFHLAALAWMTRLGVRLTGERGALEPTIVIALVLAYVFVLPVRTPVVRAAAMTIAILLADALGRRYDRLALLAWVGAAVLLWRPMDLFAIGYQLTFGITAFLLVLAGRQRADDRARLSSAPRAQGLRRAAWAALACWLVATPAIATHTGLLSPVGPIATLVCTPLIVIALALGYAGALASIVVPPIAGVIEPALVGAGSAIAWIVRALDALPGSGVPIARPSVVWSMCATVAAFWVGVRFRWRDPRPWALLVALSLWLGVEHALDHRTPAGVRIRVDTLAVGDGSCHLIRSGGAAALWDAGSMRASMLERRLPDAINALGPARVRVAFVTHANLDHFNALPDAADRLGVERVYTTEAFVRAARMPGSGAALLVESLDELGVDIITLGAGDTFELGRAQAHVLWPPRDLPDRGVTSVNDTSLVVRFDVDTDAGVRSVLMTGDIQDGAMANLRDTNISAAAMEAPHHGSVTPGALEFVRVVDPVAVLQSTGPRRAERGGWEALTPGRAWMVTAIDGAAFAEIRADGRVRTGSVR